MTVPEELKLKAVELPGQSTFLTLTLQIYCSYLIIQNYSK